MTGTGRVGVGVIGAGVISTQYLENLTSFPDLDVRFIADIDESRARAQAVAFGIPGFGSVEDMSRPEIIERINAAQADMVVVSLGARDGKEVR